MALHAGLAGLALLAAVIVGVLAWPRRYRGRAPVVQVLVLGDVGRSPRMQYHALSLARRGHVQLIGYYESDLLEELDRHPRLTKVPLAPAPAVVRRLPFAVGGPLKVVWQVLDLAVALAYRTRPARWLLVQNPPSIPTLAVAALVAALRGTRLLVDWHNYGWSILATTRGARHPFVRVAARYEAFFGRFADAHLAVTAAMAAQLRKPPYSLPPAAPLAVLHDRPAALFQPEPLDAAHPFPPAGRGEAVARILGCGDGADDDRAAVRRLLADPRTKVLVSSTSWTPDEDLRLLLDGMVQYANERRRHPERPPVLVVITGKGPMRAAFEDKVRLLTRAPPLLAPDAVAIRTAFLPMHDYARLLALADVGVCLHTSSSGVDLPMKIVDMFGAGLPVLAYENYASFGELVREGDNGRGFMLAGQLAGLLAELLPDAAALARLRAGARRESTLRWAEEWDRVVVPLLALPALVPGTRKTE